MKRATKCMLGLTLAAPLAAVAKERPNIVFFLVDDMGWVDSSVAYGEEVYARLPLNVITYSSEAPIINLKQNLVYVKVGQTFDPKDYVQDVKDCNKNEIDVNAVFVYRQVDLDKPGYGQVRMEVTDQWGHRGITYLTVIVEE